MLLKKSLRVFFESPQLILIEVFMLKAVFRSNELVTLPDKIVIESPTSYPEIAHLRQVEEDVEDSEDVEVYLGPTADDLRREAEAFKTRWEEEKGRMISNAKAEAENLITDAQQAAFEEVKRKTDEAQVIKQQAEEEAERIISDANFKVSEIENEARQSLESERKEALDKGRDEGREDGFAEGKAEVDRLIERTQVVLQRAQDKRGEILKETEKQIVDLVLLITRKVIKVISENQKNIIISNVIEALRKVRAKGNVIIRVNLADLALATEHKQEFINLMEGVQSIQIMEDGSVDKGGCIIETDFGEIDARISSQLAELESKILEISPMKSSIKDNLPPPVIRTANLNADLAASSALMNAVSNMDSAVSPNVPEASGAPNIPSALSALSALKAPKSSDDSDSGEEELSPAASAALTASAALAALATLGTKGRRDTDKKLQIT
jgi:flagellar assembly protein FliH